MEVLLRHGAYAHESMSSQAGISLQAALVVAGVGIPTRGVTRKLGELNNEPPESRFQGLGIRPMCFALADALDLWRVQGIDLAAALAALLFQHAPGQEQR